jgi:copper chaperone CopZ
MEGRGSMKKTVTYNTPILYGDHHVLEVRRLLQEMPGVEDIYASSAFRIVEVTYDDETTSEELISQKLDVAGYLGDWSLPAESEKAAMLETDRSLTYYRHTEVYETSREVVSFAQRINYSGRPLWNCPGFGVIKNKMED